MTPSAELDTSPRTLRAFGGLLLAFVGLLGVVAWWRGAAFLWVAVALTAAWFVSLALNRAQPLRAQVVGGLLPALVAGVGLPAWWGVDPFVVALGVWSVGGLVAGAVLGSTPLARRVFVGWTSAAEPIGWTVSMVLLALVYYGVVTPTALVARLVGRDALARRLDREAASYWVERPRGGGVDRYFRQY